MKKNAVASKAPILKIRYRNKCFLVGFILQLNHGIMTDLGDLNHETFMKTNELNQKLLRMLTRQ
jgi:hypothetical protein